jgi:hypothetical protein
MTGVRGKGLIVAGARKMKAMAGGGIPGGECSMGQCVKYGRLIKDAHIF